MVRNGDLICYRETEVQAYSRLTAELNRRCWWRGI